LDPEKQRALSDFYREEFLRYMEYFKANGILSEDSQDAMQQTCSKLMADLDRVCGQDNFPAVAETLLQKFDVLTRLSELDPRKGH
jgi:hypothetical protein